LKNNDNLSAVDQPSTVQHSTTPDISNDISTPETDVPDAPAKSKKVSYPAAFEEFWLAFPTDKLMSKKAAYEKWRRLDSEDRAALAASVPGFKDYCRANPNYRPVHACRYISDRRFDGFAPAAGAVSGAGATLVAVHQETPQGLAWERYYRASKGKTPPWVNGVWRFPSEWPPELALVGGVA
jgi:hypothetical protein